MNEKTLRPLIITISILIMAPAVVLGQSVDELCREFITQAFQQLGSACANVGDEEACYGYGEVEATFFADGEPRQDLGLLDDTGDVVPLLSEATTLTTESYETADFRLDRQNPEDSEYGIMVQLVRGNLPRQLPQNTMIMIQFGGTRIENAVFPREAVVIPETPTVVSYSSITLFTSPEGLDYPTESERIDTLAGGGTLEADAISPDGAWVRVFYRYQRTYGERATAWVRVDDLVDATGVGNLPVLGPDDYTAMQYLYLSSQNFGNQPCDAVPEPTLVVQGPDGIETDFYINDAPIRITSTAIFEHISPNTLRVTSVDGIVQIFFETPNEIVVPAGFAADLCLETPQDLGIDARNNDRPLDPECPNNRLIDPNEELIRFIPLEDLPPNIIPPFVIPRIVCFSTVGGPVCELRYPPAVEQRLIGLCQEGILPDRICDLINP